MNATDHPLLTALLRGERRAIARAISAVENDAGAEPIVVAVAPRLGRAHVIGITGTPGAGKSALINALLGELLRRGRSIAVLAVDPSSPISGGAVLGDRVRMGEHGAHERVFIRSIASRGHLGGVSRSTRRIVDVLDAAGFDTVIVETVGAGQSEVEIIEIADTRIVVCPPGLGDDVQAIKAGILEIGDLLVVNKADLPAAETTARDLQEMIRLRSGARSAVEVLKTSATRGDGITELADRIEAHASSAGVGQRLARRPRTSTDDIAAVDRVIASCSSVPRFLPRPVPRRVVEEILDVARQVPSSTGPQPWRVHVLSGKAKDRLCVAAAAAVDSSAASPVLRDGPRQRRHPGFSDAPVGLIFTIDRQLERGNWLDYGALLQNIRIAARARGLDACPQASWSPVPEPIARELALPEEEIVLCGMALGYADGNAAEAGLVPSRERVSAFARFAGFD